MRAVFSRCLLPCPDLDLWRTYLNFVKRVRGASVWVALAAAEPCELAARGSGSGSGGRCRGVGRSSEKQRQHSALPR